jgi:hypothetical protein
MNLKGFERERSWPNRDNSPAFSLVRLQETVKTAMTLAGILAEIRSDTSRTRIYSVTTATTSSVGEFEWMQMEVMC